MPTSEQEQLRVGVGVFIRDKADRVLLEKRKDCGLWCLPGGMLDSGERVEQAAVREVKEETGLAVQITGLVGIYSDPRHRLLTYPDTGASRLIDVVVRAEVLGGTLRVSPESFEVKFFEEDLLPELLPRAVQPIRDALMGRAGVIS